MSGDRAAAGGLGLVSLLFQLPFLMRGVSFLDEGSLLVIARDLAQGDVLYRDHYTFIAPLAYEALALLFDLFGPQLIVGRVAQALVFTLTVLVVFGILREFVGTRWSLVGAAVCLPLKLLSFPLWTIPNYSQLAMLTSLLAVAAGLRFVATQRMAWLAAAGIAVGLTVVTKQSLGAGVAGAVGIAVVVSVLTRGGARLTPLLRPGAVLAGATAGPILLTLAYFAVQGALAPLVDRAVWGLFEVGASFGVPLPGLGLWSLGDDLESQAFRYFPSFAVALHWQAELDLGSVAVALPIEIAVKAAYYLPPVAIVLCAVGAARAARRGADVEAGCRALVASYAALAYGSIMYRADLTHLLSVAPPLLIVCVLELRRWADTSSSGRVVAGSLAGLWLAIALLAGGGILAVYDTPIETDRGRLIGTRMDARNVDRVLGHLDAQAREARILLLRSDPLYYLLADRPVPGPFDLLLPGYLRPGDDARLAEGLSRIDQVIYSPAVLPTVPLSIRAYAPETASRLARDFAIVKILGPNALVLAPGAWSGSAGVPLEFGEAPREDWLMYEVVTSTLEPSVQSRCRSSSHLAAKGDRIRVTPMLHPKTWAPLWALAEARVARFEMRVTPEGAPREVLFSEIRHAKLPPRQVQLSLSAFAGERILLELCVSREDAETGSPLVRAGWANPRILKRDALR